MKQGHLAPASLSATRISTEGLLTTLQTWRNHVMLAGKRY